MIFRDIMRCVSGVCCAVVLLCGESKLEGMSVEAGEKMDETVRHESYPLTLDFPQALYYRKKMGAPEWETHFTSIAPIVSEILLDQSDRNLQLSYDAIYYISLSAFDSFSKYCDSVSKESKARGDIFSFLSLFPIIIAKLQSDSSDLAIEFESLLLRGSQGSSPLVSKKDEPLFLRVAELIAPYMSD